MAAASDPPPTRPQGTTGLPPHGAPPLGDPRARGTVIKGEIQGLHERGARLLHLGSLDRLPPRLRQQVLDAVELTKNNRRITVAVAFDYGGRGGGGGGGRRM